MDPTFGILAVVVGFIIAGAIQILGQVVSGRQATAQDGAKRQDDRRLARDAFQRETLLALQDAIYDFSAINVAYLARHEGIVPDADLPTRNRIATARVITLRSRVADEEIRRASADFVKGSGLLSNATNADEATAAWSTALEAAKRAVDRSGALIQATFVEPVAPARGQRWLGRIWHRHASPG